MSTAEQEARQMIADKKAAAAAEKAYNAASSTPAAPASKSAASTSKRSPAVQEAIQDAQDEKDRKKIKAMGFSKGGGVKRADGCITKGHTKGTMVAMNRGGKC
jgi:dienelactone hydrolase